jgi:hypothetical protein
MAARRKGNSKGLVVLGSLRKDGITTYMKQGRLIIRSANSMEKRSNTLPQFIQRQKMRHSVALWKMLKYCKPIFTKGATAYNNFLSLANKLPVVYVEKNFMKGVSFLMPGIPVSDGTLQEIKQHLGEVDGAPALITDLQLETRKPFSELWLYTATQTGSDNTARVQFSVRKIPWTELALVDEHYVLKGEEFADDMKGWALVMVNGDRCSPQTIATRCTMYQQYTTEEALQNAAKSYKGLTNRW